MDVKAVLAWLVGAMLASPLIAAGTEPNSDDARPVHYVQDSTITTAVKTKLAADQIGSLTHLTVDSDSDGVVWLSGTTRTQEAADRAVESARNASGVTWVRSSIVVNRTGK